MMLCDLSSIIALDSTDIDMGFCMVTSGMTQGTQLDMAVGENEGLEDGESVDKTELMEDDQDTEVLQQKCFLLVCCKQTLKLCLRKS